MMPKRNLARATSLCILAFAGPVAAQDLEECQRPYEDLISEANPLDLPPLVSPVNAFGFLTMEMFVRSERLSKTGVNVLQLRSSNEFTGGPNADHYFRALEIPGSGDCAGIQFLAPIPPEEVTQMELQAAGVEAPLATFMELYGEFLLVGSAAVDATVGVGSVQNQDFMMELATGCPNTAKIDDYSETVIQNTSMVAFMAGPICFLHAAGRLLREDQTFSILLNELARSREDLEAAAAIIRLMGTEEVGGVQAQKIVAEDIGIEYQAGDVDVEIDNMHVWIDTETYTRRKLRYEGSMTSGGESRPFFLERELDDYRIVPETVLYEPYREILRMGGMLGPEELAEMQRASAELDEFERRLADMPADQRATVQRMMGSQIEEMRRLAQGDTFEFTRVTESITVNPDFAASRGATLPVEGSEALVEIIQRKLIELEYYDGAIDGTMNPATVSAIRRFEADQGMPVRGEATHALARAVLAADGDRP